MEAGAPYARAARRGGVVSLVLAPLLAAIGVVFFALTPSALLFLPAGAALVLFAAVLAALGLAAIRRSGPVAALRAAAAVVAIVGIGAVLVVGLTVHPQHETAGNALSIAGLSVMLVAAWSVCHTLAGAIRKAETSAR